jgi:hypothetical protein
VTIAGDTTGTWNTTNDVGVRIAFGLGVGSSVSGTAGSWGSTRYFSATGATSVVGTNGATFYITGVQLEKGSTATSFDYRPYGTEFMLCQRYYQRDTTILVTSVTNIAQAIALLAAMRTAPTMSVTPNAGSGATLAAIGNNYFYQSVANSAYTGGVFTATAEL